MKNYTQSNDDVELLIQKARLAFTNRQPKAFHDIFSKNCDDYIAKENSLNCIKCGLVVPYSPEMLEDAIELFKTQFDI